MKLNPRLRHVGISVRDMNVMAKFYEELGFKRLGEYLSASHEEWGNRLIDVIKFQDQDGNGLELISSPWQGHISLTVDELPTNGVGPWKRGDDVDVAYIQDPEGNWIELVKEKP